MIPLQRSNETFKYNFKKMHKNQSNFYVVNLEF